MLELKHASLQDKRRGPFPASQLIKWLSKGFFGREFHCQHGATRAWIPLWLIVAHYNLAGSVKKVTNPDTSLEKTLTCEGDSHQVAIKVLLCDSDDDVDMEDVEVVVKELRHDKDFNQVGNFTDHLVIRARAV